ncbi:MAG: YdeI/OmpD-associated family protein [Chitinophagaceae bacterium]
MENKKEDLPILIFNAASEFEQWLNKNYASSNGIWLRIYKKASGIATVTYPEAVKAALCYGWIDGVANKYDEESYLQRFTPRRSKSIWSKLNVERANQLINSGKMKPGGLKEIEAAKADGRWASAYDSPANIEIPKDFLQALSKKPQAKKFFKTLNKTNTYSIAWRLQTARKPETREKRMKLIPEMLSRGQKFH